MLELKNTKIKKDEFYKPHDTVQMFENAILQHDSPATLKSMQIRRIRKFYRQEFEPEMIIKYFKHWEMTKHSQTSYIFNLPTGMHDVMQIEVKPIGNIPQRSKGGETFIVDRMYINTQEIYPLPQTLGDFINICLLCEISLYWK